MAKKEQMSKVMELERPKPSIMLTDKEVPELKNWEVGKTYPLSFKKARLKSIRESYEDKSILEANFEIE
jgi:hypothetical protein